MNIRDLCKRDVVTVRPADDLSVAARLMRDKHVGYLVVVEPALKEGAFKPVGVLTDRDIVVTVVARDTDPRSLRVEDVMTRQPTTTREDDSVATALRQMRRIGIRRIPVVGGLGQLVGVLSLDDVLDALADQLQNVAGSIQSEQLVESVLRP